ncbi:hypothetical protein PO909_028104 [Leuciscus waleckii]
MFLCDRICSRDVINSARVVQVNLSAFKLYPKSYFQSLMIPHSVLPRRGSIRWRLQCWNWSRSGELEPHISSYHCAWTLSLSRERKDDPVCLL